MTAYRYRALNAKGKLVRGVLEGDSERQVRSQLRGQGLRPVEIGEANQPEPAAGSGLRLPALRSRISAGDLAMITRQLATLVQSNLPLDECLQAAAEQSRKARTKAAEALKDAYVLSRSRILLNSSVVIDFASIDAYYSG